MLGFRYSLVIEATEEPDFFSFYSPDIEGFSGVGHSVEDCLYKAKWGVAEHLNLLAEQGLPVPPARILDSLQGAADSTLFAMPQPGRSDCLRTT